VTVLPVSAKHVPVTKPTYPVPTTAIFMKIKGFFRVAKISYSGHNNAF
jgi:hypothetical protein